MESLNLTINSLKSTSSSLRDDLIKYCTMNPKQLYLLHLKREVNIPNQRPLPIATEAFYAMNQKPSGKENSQNNQNCL